ncbi:30S ribosomal protein THX [Epilithonimonas zeae]|uniref:SSU ribosomal protein S31P n=1 Tax=Epilithonimonas zeae TaxID=1416779 RepID=A0A1N6JUV3_9FLAO|nr:30S ribosomal protein THX [Epilithonimonas zeae]SIO48148.1 SSU ribosomal protein S31P [Epilithonimonas zeae]
MGKGDQKSTRGKRVRGSYGKTRPRKSSQPIAVTEKPTKVKAEPKPKTAKPKAEKAEKAEETEEKPKVKRTKKAEE